MENGASAAKKQKTETKEEKALRVGILFFLIIKDTLELKSKLFILQPLNY